MAVYKEVQTADVVDRPVVIDRRDYGMNMAARIIYFIGGIILILLGFRLLLALLGANPANAFANFIYTTSHPFASPFFSLFSYDQTLGRSRFEVGTLVAIIVYAVVMSLLARLVTIGSRRPVDHRV